MAIYEYIKSDLYRYYGKSDLLTFLKALCNSTIRFQIILRMCQTNGLLKYAGADRPKTQPDLI